MLKFLKDLFSSAPPSEGEKHPLDGPTKKAVEVTDSTLSSTWPFPTGEKPVTKKETKDKPAKAAKPAAPKTTKPKAPAKPKAKKK